MGLRNFFSAKDPEDYDQKGDAFSESEKWGKAKVEYERALQRLDKTAPWDDGYRQNLREKIQRCREALALEHRQTAADLMEAGHYEDADGFIELALELTEDDRLQETLEKMRQSLAAAETETSEIDLADIAGMQSEPIEQPPIEEQDDDHFRALVGTLPDDVQAAYRSYGQTFKTGYLALNRGEFEAAEQYLSRAMEENADPHSYIPLELANACLNMGDPDRARDLLEAFLDHHPDALPAYQLLCEIFWETGAFEQAEALLSSLPAELSQSVAACLLRGETLYQAQNYALAKSWYRDFLKTYGWDESIARELAKTHEALNEMANARNLYLQIMQQCSSCGARIDPMIKQKFADLSFASGLNTVEILELYLSLAQEIPKNAGACYEKISHIYAAQGNVEQARRFGLLAEKFGGKNKEELLSSVPERPRR